jgi:hypothetical protein
MSGPGARVGWKYFTLFCDDGTVAAGALCADRKDCGLWLSLYGRESLALDRTYPLDRLSLSAQGMQAGGGSLRWSDDVLSLDIREAGVALDVTARRLVDWQDNRLTQAMRSQKISWEVPGLRMGFSGRLSRDGRTRDISGLMFHDEVWHDLAPSAHLLLNLRSWRWGILYSKSYSILFVQVDYQPAPFHFLCVSGPQGTVSSNHGLRDCDFELRPGRGSPSTDLDIIFRGERLHVELPLRRAVHHGGGLAKLFSRLFRPKHHACGRFAFRGEEGRAYVESMRFH